MSKNAYRGHRFPPAIIQLTVWMYARFTLSLRDVEGTSRGEVISRGYTRFVLILGGPRH